MFTFGSDPEFMLVKGNTLYSAIKILPNKDNALLINGNKLYHDNVLAEINVKVSNNLEETLVNIHQCLKDLDNYIYDKKILIKSAANYPESELLDEEAIKVCQNSEWDAYTLNCNLPPKDIIKNTCFRTAGGHIHVGNNTIKNDMIKKLYCIRMMDLFVGIPSIIIDKDKSSEERRKIYGKAGSHRLTDYGVEYRTLSNFWYKSPKHVELIYSLTKFAIDFVISNKHNKFWSVDENICYGYDTICIQKAINEKDLNLTDNFLTFISNYLPKKLFKNLIKLSKNNKNYDLYHEWNL